MSIGWGFVDTPHQMPVAICAPSRHDLLHHTSEVLDMPVVRRKFEIKYKPPPRVKLIMDKKQTRGERKQAASASRRAAKGSWPRA